MTIVPAAARSVPLRPATRRWLLAAVLVVALLLPFVLSDFRTFQLTLILAYAIALFGLNLLMGFNGQISVGHGAFFAVGGYTAAILMMIYGVPYWATVPIAAAVAFLVGFLFGIPALRLEGIYLAMATFSLGVTVPQLLRVRAFEPWTGGVLGIVMDKPEVPFGLPINQDQWLYYFVLAFTCLLFALGYNLTRGRIGRAIVAIRDQPLAAASMGVNIALYKSATFGISAGFTGLAGALATITVAYVSPDSFPILLSISLLVGVVVGGLGSAAGMFFGAAFIVLVPNMAGSVSKALPWAIYGLGVIVIMYVAPLGVGGLAQQVMARLRRPASGHGGGKEQ
ncbi:branched-chain amino acid ABC transporter permease [Microbaculum marinum]|uniref:Branched-chain amino acid ABC transporter permease n=1 Tax=Microbaculum marinum TaxID=1764581 RepID=A0AAW9RDK1_9HYPH